VKVKPVELQSKYATKRSLIQKIKTKEKICSISHCTAEEKIKVRVKVLLCLMKHHDMKFTNKWKYKFPQS
jgi:hypothetical protein